MISTIYIILLIYVIKILCSIKLVFIVLIIIILDIPITNKENTIMRKLFSEAYELLHNVLTKLCFSSLGKVLFFLKKFR